MKGKTIVLEIAMGTETVKSKEKAVTTKKMV
jgi:hypothetical protein